MVAALVAVPVLPSGAQVAHDAVEVGLLPKEARADELLPRGLHAFSALAGQLLKREYKSYVSNKSKY